MLKELLVYERISEENAAMIFGDPKYTVVNKNTLKLQLETLIKFYGVEDFYSNDLSPLTLEAGKILRRLQKNSR